MSEPSNFLLVYVETASEDIETYAKLAEENNALLSWMSSLPVIPS
jgi:hypothetical protein